MKKLIVLFMICCTFTACGLKEETKEATDIKAEPIVEVESEAAAEEEVEVDVEIEEEVEAEADTEEMVEAAIISPLPTTIDVNALDSCTLAVSFEKGDAYVDDTGAMKLDVTVYTYDLYDMVDIASLKEGDTIVVRGENVPVETLEVLDSGLVIINGGIENGGYDLWHNDSGVYFEQGMSDAKSYYPIGEASIPVSADFEFTDSSEPDRGEVIYYPGDFLTEDAGIMYHFVPHNTNIVIEGGNVISMTRVYMP